MQEVSDGVQPFNQDDKKLNEAFAYPEHEVDADGDIVASVGKRNDEGAYENGLNLMSGQTGSDNENIGEY